MALTLIVNDQTVKFKLIKNLEEGKEVSEIHAIRNIPDIGEAIDALMGLVREGLVERREFRAGNGQYLPLYRYRTELDFFRKYGNHQFLQ